MPRSNSPSLLSCTDKYILLRNKPSIWQRTVNQTNMYGNLYFVIMMSNWKEIHLKKTVSKRKHRLNIKTSKPSGHCMYRQFNIQQFSVLPTQCIYVFCVDLRTNSDYFPIQHWLTGLYNRDGVFTARYGLDIYIQFYVLPTHCIYVFCVDLRTNSDYFPIQH